MGIRERTEKRSTERVSHDQDVRLGAGQVSEVVWPP